MVNMIRKALAGFILLPGKERTPAPEVPYLPEAVICRASALRGYSDKDRESRFMLLNGHEEADILRRLRAVVVEDESPLRCGRYEEGLNLVVFRGVYGSGGYSVEVRTVRLDGRTLVVECDYEDPGDGIRTTAGFTQPTAIIPLKRLPEGKYEARLSVRQFCRSARGLREEAPAREVARFTFKVRA